MTQLVYIWNLDRSSGGLDDVVARSKLIRERGGQIVGETSDHFVYKFETDLDDSEQKVLQLRPYAGEFRDVRIPNH